MTDEIDTSAERVEWLAGMLEVLDAYSGAETLRALAGERTEYATEVNLLLAEIESLEAQVDDARDERDAERQRAEKAEALLENLVTRGPFIGGCCGYEPGLRQLLLNYYGDYFSAMKAAEYTEKYIAYLRQDEGGE